MLRLECTAQSYAWGRKPSENSEVASLIQAAGQSVDTEQPYAELWMGSHPSGMSYISGSSGKSLKEWISECPERALGKKVLERFGTDLPFLFKVLSVATALSIQSHPDKKLAKRLHAERPEVYKDDNHKPEMTVAISDFEALCGFVSGEELSETIEAFPELHPCLEASSSCNNNENSSPNAPSSDGTDQHKQELRAKFTALMTCEPTKVKTAIDALRSRLRREGPTRKLSLKEQLFLRLDKQYPGDVGLLAIFFLNFLQLKKGQAIYLPANVPHAYVSGQLIECMATSDNVIRAGLTPKLRDTEVLCNSLTYEQGLPTILEGDSIQEYTTVYSPPFEEFEVFRVDLPPSAETLIPANRGPAVLLVAEGQGDAKCQSSLEDPLLLKSSKLSRGSVFFVPAETALRLRAEKSMCIWIAAVHSQVFADLFKLPIIKDAVASI